MTGIELPALRPTHPLGWMAALGLLTRLPGTRLSWRSESGLTPSAILHGQSSLDKMVDALDAAWAAESRRRSLTVNSTWPPEGHVGQAEGPYDPTKIIANQYQYRAEELGDEGHPWLRGVVTDLVLAERTVRGAAELTVERTELYLLSKRQTFPQQLATLWKLDEEERRIELRRAVSGWVRADSETGMNWDLGGNTTGAEDPLGDPTTRVPRGATWLAVGALPLLPVVGARGRARTRGWSGISRSRALRMPAWSPALDASAVQCLASHPDVVRPDVRPGMLRGLGVTGLWESRRLVRRPAGTPEYFLEPATRVA